jgi:hypothetical protein
MICIVDILRQQNFVNLLCLVYLINTLNKFVKYFLRTALFKQH